MKDYTVRICEVFLEKYPKSAAYQGGRRLRVGHWENIFPEIERDYRSKHAFLDSVDELCEQGICEAGWRRYREGENLEALYLADPERLYTYTRRLHPDQVRTDLKQHLAKLPDHPFNQQLLKLLLQDKVPLPELFRADTQQELEKVKSILHDTSILLELDGSLRDRLTLRQLSVHLFYNSKRIEQLLPAVDALAKNLTGERLSEALGLVRSYPETTCSLPGHMLFPDNSRWELGGRMLTLPLETVNQVTAYIPEHQGQRVLLLENKESFYVLGTQHKRDFFSGYMYLGGYPNTADAALLDKLSQSGVSLYCFCDLDPAGLLIVQQVARICAVPIEIYRMDEQTYSKYLDYGYVLKNSELRKLSGIEDTRLRPLARLIAQHKKGIEQEIIQT
ncbi:MAG: DUF2399 domain-containing protein [Spirochaetota bacterium]